MHPQFQHPFSRQSFPLSLWGGYKEELPVPSCSVSKSEHLSAVCWSWLHVESVALSFPNGFFHCLSCLCSLLLELHAWWCMMVELCGPLWAMCGITSNSIEFQTLRFASFLGSLLGGWPQSYCYQWCSGTSWDCVAKQLQLYKGSFYLVRWCSFHVFVQNHSKPSITAYNS